MELREIIGKNIIELRKQNKLTQAELAQKINYTDKAISKWERGESIPEIETLKNIANLFGVTVDFLLTENAIVNIKQFNMPKNIIRNRKILAASSAVVILIIACVVFLYGYIYMNPHKIIWQAFVWAIPIIAMTLLFFNKKWGKHKYSVYLLSIILWSLLICIWISTIQYQTWLVFVIGVPIQALIILLCLLKR